MSDSRNAKVSSEFADIVEEFAEETGLYGLNILRRRIGRFEAVFWILCTCCFAYCTVRDVSSVTLAFLEGDTLSRTLAVTNSVLVLDPAPTFSFMHGLLNVDFSELPADAELEQMLTDFLVAFKNATHKSGNLVIGTALFDLFATILHDMTYGELAVLSPSQYPEVGRVDWASQFKQRPNFGLISSAVEKVYTRLRAERIDFTKLIKLVACQFCRNAEFAAYFHSYFSGRERLSLCTPSHILVFGPNYITFKYSDVPLKFADLDDHAHVSWNARRSQRQRVSVDFSGTAQTDNQNENSYVELVYTNESPERVTTSFTVLGDFQRTSEKRSQPCSKEQRRYDCIQRCYTRVLVNLCNCYPLYFATAYEPNGMQNATVCPYTNATRETEQASGVVDYVEACTKMNLSEEHASDERCYGGYDECLPDCRARTFIATVVREKKVGKVRNEFRSSLALQAQSFTFPVVKEKLSITFSDLVSQIGGILGLYIGVSFAGLIHVPIFAIRKTVQHFRQRSNRSERCVHPAADTSGSAMNSDYLVSSAKWWPSDTLELREQVHQWFEMMGQRFDSMEERLKKAKQPCE